MSLKGNLAKEGCVGKCGMPNDNEDRIDNDRLIHDDIYLESDLCSSKVHHIIAIHIVDMIEYIHIKYMSTDANHADTLLPSFNEKLCR